MKTLIKKILSASPGIRYAAIYADGKLTSSVHPGLGNPSSSESDKYEELIVNPTLLKLVMQRGNIDCGGAEYVIVRYGSFYEFVRPFRDGHLSVGIEPDADLPMSISAIQDLIHAI